LHEICPYKFGAKVRLIYEILKRGQVIVTDLTISLPKVGNDYSYKSKKHLVNPEKQAGHAELVSVPHTLSTLHIG